MLLDHGMVGVWVVGSPAWRVGAFRLEGQRLRTPVHRIFCRKEARLTFLRAWRRRHSPGWAGLLLGHGMVGVWAVGSQAWRVGAFRVGGRRL